MQTITKTCLYNFDPRIPHFYIVKLGFTEVYIISLIFAQKQAYLNILNILPPKTESYQEKNSDVFHISDQNIDCGYSLEPPRRGGSNEYHNLCFELNKKK